MNKILIALAIFSFLFFKCSEEQKEINSDKPKDCIDLLAEFKVIKLEVDTSHLSSSEKKIIPIFEEISGLIDKLFWYQSYGNYNDWASVNDSCLKSLIDLNFGPWDRFRNNQPLIDTVGERSAGSNFYPDDMTKEEFNALTDSLKTSPYTYIRRNKQGKLISVPYSAENKIYLTEIVRLLKKAAALTDNKGFKAYLLKRADDLLSDNFIQSDLAWLNCENNLVDFIIGPIDIYDDRLFGYKTEYESYLIIKDIALTQKYSRYAKMLPFLQKALPVPIKYRAEDPEKIAELSIANILKYGGGARAGGYTISATFPSALNEVGHKNQRNIQFKNTLDLKYEYIFYPLAKNIISKEQLEYVNKESYFQNSIFFELGQRLGIQHILTDGSTVRNALKEHATIIQIVEAYAMSLYIAEKLYSVNEVPDLKGNYTVFLTNIFRMARFESSNPYAKAKIIIFNFLSDKQAIKRNHDGLYAVNFDKIKESIDQLIEQILVIQGDGNYNEAKEFISKYLTIKKSFQQDINKLSDIHLYKDIIVK